MSNILGLSNLRLVSSQTSRVASCLPLIQEKCTKLHQQLLQVYKIKKSKEVYEKNMARTFTSTSILTAARRKTSNRKKGADPIRFSPKPMKVNNVVSVTTDMTVEKLAEAVDRTPDDIFEVLLYVDGGDRYEKENSVIDDFNVIKDVVKKLGMRYMMQETSRKKEVHKEKSDVPRQPPPDPAVLVKRPPVVTIMGHVDHGKTTLLDYLRKSKIVDKEFGGITQHIGAFSVQLASGETITFLDTPGHAAFSAMRARGAQVTDIVVLVVAADDGVMQQTVESIQHAKEANVPIIVAVNKMDKPEADLERTKRMLMQHQLVIEEYGGDVQVVPISALKGTNIPVLQEAIVTLAEMLEIKADPDGLVEGHVVESRTDPGRGKLVTAIVQRGTLTKGAIIVAGNTWAKVRGMFNESGKPIQSAPPSTPVEIIGWRDLPSAGDDILEATSEKIAKEAVDYRLEQEMENKSMEDQEVIKEKRAEHQKIYLEEIERKRQLGYRRKMRKKREKETIITHEGPQLSLVLKGDVDGSLEAILDTLATYRSKKCRLDIIHYGVGNITEQDVKMAETFNGIVMGFNVIAPSAIRNLAKSCQVPVSIHQVIYRLFDDLHSKLSEKLPLLQETDMIGEAKVLKVFHISSGKNKIAVAGCRCTKGLISKKKNIKVLRKDEVIYDGPIESLKHLKKEVDTIKLDVECGISIEDKSVEFKEGDMVECYEVREVQQVIDWEPGF